MSLRKINIEKLLEKYFYKVMNRIIVSYDILNLNEELNEDVKKNLLQIHYHILLI